MSYYCFNRKDILQKAKERYSNEKAPEYYLENKELIQNLSKESKDKINEYQRKRYKQLIQYKKEALQNK